MNIKDTLQQIDEMTINELLHNQFIESLKYQKSALSNSDKRFLSNEISNFRKLGADKTLKRILLYSIWCPDEAVEVSRKKGVFRYKAWELKKNHAEFILQTLKEQSQILNYSQETCQFINTKLQLAWMFTFYKKSEEKLIQHILKHHRERKRIKIGNSFVEEALFKELLAYADSMFYFHDRGSSRTNHTNKNLLSCYGEEEISESISYLIFLYDSTIGIKPDCHYTVSPGYVLSDAIEKLILMGCKVHQLQEWEVCIDYFNFRIREIRENITIYDIEETFEKTIRLGYVRRDMQENLFYMENKEKSKEDVLSLSEICTYIKEKLGSQLISSVGAGNLSRYRFEFPEPLFSPFKKESEFGNKLFQEEALLIGHCAKELIISNEEVFNKKITEHCTLFDVVMFQRLFVLLNMTAAEILFEQKDRMKIIRSLIPSFQSETLVKLLSIFIGDETKAQELLELFTYQGDIKLDLQYTPLLKVSGGLVFATSLASKSNLPRNCIAHSYLLKNQVVNMDEREPLVLECQKVFANHCQEYTVFTNKKFSYLQKKGEIDVLVISQTDIIIIECKSPLSPTNNFEMRASYDHIIKAANQLNLSKSAFEDLSFRKNFLKNLGVDDSPRKIHTCIVFGNRLFNGYTIKSHPVRYIRELDMILNNGHIYSGVGTWRIWLNAEYSHDDLINFISPQYNLGKANLDAMVKTEQFMYVSGKKVSFETYAFNFAKIVMQYDKLFLTKNKNHELREQLDIAYKEYLKSNGLDK